MSFKFWSFALILAISLNLFLTGEEISYTEVPDQTHVPLLTPSLAQRQTLKMRLSNGLEAYLISDPEATQAGAVLTVQAGSWDDPEEYPGLAHFLEHMLFLGTEKYPIESDYDRFIRTNNGQFNAYTAGDYTLYVFSIAPKAFEEALDRFSFFFKKPLFNPSGIERELHAVDQEFAKDLNQEGSRENYVNKELANVEHPFHSFSIGNSATLSEVTQDTLREWYQEHYSAQSMRLIIYGPDSLETLKSWAIQDFKEIPSTGQPPSIPQVSILAEETEGKFVYIEPIKNIKTLRMSWELPMSFASQIHEPQNLISSILEDEGGGSLLAILKEEGLAENLDSSSETLGKNHLFFSLDIHLTEKGQDQIYRVIERSFQAIQFLKQQDLPSFLFEEFNKTHLNDYQYQSGGDVYYTLMNLGGLLVYDDLGTFPESALLPQEFDQNSVREFLDRLTPQKAHFTLLTHNPPVDFNQREQWMKVSYAVESVSSEHLSAWSNLSPHPQMHLPAPNPFIPQELRLVNPSSQLYQKTLPFPQLLVDNAQGKMYFSLDNRFQLPQTMWFFEIKTPLIEDNDPRKEALADIYIESLEETLQSYRFQAKVAGISYHISRTENGILLSFTGYPDSSSVLFDIMMTKLKNCRPSEHLFKIIKDSFLNQYDRSNQETPLGQGLEAYKETIYDTQEVLKQRANALEDISYEELLNYIDHLYDQTYVNGLLYGNIEQEQAMSIWEKLQSTLDSQVFHPEHRLIEETSASHLQSGPYLMELRSNTPAHAAILGLEIAEFSPKTRAAQQILAQAMNSSFFATLRTKQQTGYLVFSRAEEFDNRLITFFAVQSTSHDPRDLLARFELFIENYLEDIGKNELTKEQFENIRQALLVDLENSPQNFVDTGHMLKTLAFKYGGDFERMDSRIQGFKDLNYEEFLEITKQFLGKSNKQRLAILIRGATDQDFHYKSI